MVQGHLCSARSPLRPQTTCTKLAICPTCSFKLSQAVSLYSNVTYPASFGPRLPQQAPTTRTSPNALGVRCCMLAVTRASGTRKCSSVGRMVPLLRAARMQPLYRWAILYQARASLSTFSSGRCCCDDHDDVGDYGDGEYDDGDGDHGCETSVVNKDMFARMFAMRTQLAHNLK